MASPPRYIVGIDLGTTNTVVAYADTKTQLAEGEAPAIQELEIEQLVSPGEVTGRPMLPSARYQPAEGQLKPEDRELPWRDPDDDGADELVFGQPQGGDGDGPWAGIWWTGRY